MTIERLQTHPDSSSKETTFSLPIGTTIENPLSLTQDDWQDQINAFYLQNSTLPESFLSSAALTYSVARGIEIIFQDHQNLQVPSMTLYANSMPGMIKNFFSTKDMSIYFNTKWLARIASIPINESQRFITEQYDELVFEGTPYALANLLGMEEAQHALDFQQNKLDVAEGRQYRSEVLVAHDSKDAEFRALKINLDRMKNMPNIYSDLSIRSIENRIKNAEKHRHNSDNFFLSRFF